MSREARRIAVVSLNECPKCGARPGLACVGKGGRARLAPHRERIFALDTGKVITKKEAKTIRRQREAGADPFYLSDEWRRVRYRALRKYGNACQCCGAPASPGAPLHVDHIKPRSRFPELALDVDNLQILCVDCNLGKGGWDETDWRARGARKCR